MEIVSISGVKELTEQLEKFPKHLQVLFFFLKDSAECNQMSEVISEFQIDKANKNSVVLKVDASKNEEICKKYDIANVPAFVFMKGGTVLDNLVGANVPALAKKFQENMENLEDKLRKLINKAPIMLFMKGNRDTPRCGFSKQAIALLNNHNATYQTFDILEDMEVREGLKKFSNWPTYPQLYVKGDLIGGLDILKELEESNELESLLSGN